MSLKTLFELGKIVFNFKIRWGYHREGALMRDSPNRRVLCGHRRCERVLKKSRESSATETKWGPYPLSTHVNFSLTFPQVLWISPGKLWAEGIFLFLFQPLDSFCLIFKHPLFFGILFMGAARRAAQGDCKSPLSAPLENLAISTGLMRSLCSQATYDCRAVYKQRWEEKAFQKETRTEKCSHSRPNGLCHKQWRLECGPGSLATKCCC